MMSADTIPLPRSTHCIWQLKLHSTISPIPFLYISNLSVQPLAYIQHHIFIAVLEVLWHMPVLASHRGWSGSILAYHSISVQYCQDDIYHHHGYCQIAYEILIIGRQIFVFLFPLLHISLGLVLGHMI